MAESTQYSFTHKELVEMLAKKAGVTEGRWQLLVTFGFTAGNMGPDDKNLNPAAFVAVSNIGIQKVPDAGDAASPNNLSFDVGGS